jgi:hypothetical protein
VEGFLIDIRGSSSHCHDELLNAALLGLLRALLPISRYALLLQLFLVTPALTI